MPVYSSYHNSEFGQKKVAQDKDKVVTVTRCSEFKDSGPGNSLLSATSYAESAVSSSSNFFDERRPDLPALSEAAKKREPFMCDSCSKMVRVTKTQ
jgi:hypothetical protein